MFWNQVEFRYPENIIFYIIPVLILVILLMGFRKKEAILNTLNLKNGKTQKILLLVLIILGIVLMVTALMGPQVFNSYQEVGKEGLDIYILVDTSKSMLTEDLQLSRIQWSKNIIDRILSGLKGDRVGFIPFSSDAYIQMPLTDDYELARMFLKVIDTEMITGGGTNIGAALKLAVDSFQRSAQGEQVILIISDGEEHERVSLEFIDKINLDNIRIFTIGVGTEKGGLVPVFNSQGSREGYKKDQEGEYVISRLESEVLKELAKRGRGTYFQPNLAGQEIDILLDEISKLKPGQYETERIKVFTQLYQYFLGTGFLLFIIGYLLFERRKKDE